MEQKTLKIAIPEGKIPEMTETANDCTIKWVEKTFEDYADKYRCGMPYAIVPSKEPMLWPFENRMGLLKYIADCLNEEKLDWENFDQTKCELFYDHEDNEVRIGNAASSHGQSMIFTEEAAAKAKNIIPAEFIKTI
jgi:hypothetical protein